MSTPADVVFVLLFVLISSCVEAENEQSSPEMIVSAWLVFILADFTWKSNLPQPVLSRIDCSTKIFDLENI